MIAEVGKDVKPAYTNSKISADRLKRSESGLGSRLTMTWYHNILYQYLVVSTCRHCTSQISSQRLSSGH